MGLTPGKKINAIFITLMGVTFVTGGLILYWLLIVTLTNQKVLNVRAPSMIESERFLRYYGLATGGLRGFIASGEEKYIHDFEKAKAGIQESYKTLELQRLMWFIALSAIIVRTITGTLLLVFNIKYLILYWPRKTFVSSRI